MEGYKELYQTQVSKLKSNLAFCVGPPIKKTTEWLFPGNQNVGDEEEVLRMKWRILFPENVVHNGSKNST